MADFPFRFGPAPCCCPTGCGCWQQTRCFPVGDRLVSTSISEVANGGCAALHGIKKYWIWGGPSAPWWTPEDDGFGTDGYHPCLNLPNNQILSCEGTGNPCPTNPDDPPCHDYVLKMTFPSCGGTDSIDTDGICPTECTCDPFYLRFNGTLWNGGPQGPFSGGVYTFVCHCDELASCWPDTITAPDHPDNYIYRVDWEFEREYSCCCPNLDKPTAPTLRATIDSDPGMGPCGGTMEGAYSDMTSSGTGCKTFESGDITFTCADGDSHKLKFTLVCEGQIEDGFCCTDMLGTISWPAGSGNDACCIAADNGVSHHAKSGCVCDPPHFRFGPYRLWRADPADSCCRCCDEFWIEVTEA